MKTTQAISANDMLNVLILSTSPRNGLTLRFSRHLQRLITEKTGHLPELLDFRAADVMPLGKGNFPEVSSTFQHELLQKWGAADLIIFCSPEYNWTASSETFILLERMGSSAFRNFFAEKVFAVAGVSSGRGGRQPALDIGRVLSKVIGFLNVFSIVSSKLLEVHDAGLNLNEDSESLGNPAFEQALDSFIAYNLELALRWKRTSNPRD